ncbi:MAG: proton extrusion protein PcxA [Oscillatoriaceae bacterium SKW80]|nr:proton extrusion protein PcxA [Oscillatoriaceae bacterium SKYG93]MCX8121340.1 proton extrusion protein PcxA [Oscillatoriaceae bacterium SKW80]MDW8451984.1 proton extrusion protein PcxA [Oscillatoriaceae cyanobacterium SKYGB_i_bin93]HIK29526.1 proton extrusion protein PcxA [Oscillatoriaceae cyanobacterium M7585_C2015_266]
MRIPNFNIKGYLQSAGQWLLETPERALDEAYQAARAIAAIENEHFNGQKISAESANYSENVLAYFQSELTKYLNIIKVKLSTFRLSRSISSVINISKPKKIPPDYIGYSHHWAEIQVQGQTSTTLEKLKFIDKVIAKYSDEERSLSLLSPPSIIAASPGITDTANEPKTTPGYGKNSYASAVNSAKMSESIADKTSFLPRSILRTLDRLKRELDPKAEEEVLESFRYSKTKTIVSIKFILLLILIPLLTHQIAKNFIVGPIIDHFHQAGKTEIFLNIDMEEEAFAELKHFQEKLEFQMLIGAAPQLSQQEMEEKVKQKAEEIAEEFKKRSSNAIKNVFSDLLSVVAFGLVIAKSQQEIGILKSFIDDIIYGLSDSAKAFIIILFTDIFVGFHSPHGWEVILEGISRHLGLPENRSFIYLFIATFPVILDTIFKYWIFRYLNRISPSAVATYRNMNE